MLIFSLYKINKLIKYISIFYSYSSKSQFNSMIKHYVNLFRLNNNYKINDLILNIKKGSLNGQYKKKGHNHHRFKYEFIFHPCHSYI